MSQRLSILGSTGSIGVSTLDVVGRHPDRFSVYALSAHRNLDRLFEQCVAHRPKVAVVADADGAGVLAARLADAGLKIEVTH